MDYLFLLSAVHDSFNQAILWELNGMEIMYLHWCNSNKLRVYNIILYFYYMQLGL